MTDSYKDGIVIPKILIECNTDNHIYVTPASGTPSPTAGTPPLLTSSKERGRASSIDFGKFFGNRNRSKEKDGLLCSDDEEQTKSKGKNNILKKFNNMLRRGSDVPGRGKMGSLDFSNAHPTDLLFASSFGRTDELPVPITERRGSLFVQPKGTTQHKVEGDETLASIAAKYKSTVAELKSLNRLMSLLLFPGQVLFVPGEDYEREKRRSSEVFTGAGALKAKWKSQSRPCSPVVLGKVDEETIYTDTRKSKKPIVFSGEAKYLTGGDINIKGQLTISANEVRFDPDNRMKCGEMLPDHINTIIGLMKYKMGIARILHSAIFQMENPFEKKPEIIEEVQPVSQKAMFTIAEFQEKTDHDENEKQTNYLHLTLVRKVRDQRPFVEALVKMCLPGPNYVEHYFVLKPKISEDLQSFLKIYFPEQLNAEVPDPSKMPTNNNKPSQIKNSNLRRKLSIAELCNLALPELSDISHIFNDGHVRVLREFLPTRYDGRPWQLVYSTWKHGFSLKTLYRCTDVYKREEVALIIIKSNMSEVFGGLICGGSMMKSSSFYGTGESFLFTFFPSFQIYPWSKKNECFARGCSDCFIMGSSDGALGLWIDEDLHHGSSNPCETFDNQSLTSNSNFKIFALEVWTLPYDLY